MRTRSSMGKMVNKLTMRERNESFAIIDRITRGSSQPYTRNFMPQVVAVNNENQRFSKLPVSNISHENNFHIHEQTGENVVVMRSNVQNVKSLNVKPITFPEVFYEYFEVIENIPSKVG